MQAHILEVFILAKIVFYPNNKFPFMLPSHNCIIITMFSFQGASSSKLTAHVPHSSRQLSFRAECSDASGFSSQIKTRFAGLLICFGVTYSESLKRLNETTESFRPLLLQSISFVVEISGIEPLTSCLQGRRSPS